MNADHSDDLMYIFGFPFLGEEMLLPEKQTWKEDEKELSRRMMHAWSQFAKTGSPGWAQYEKKDKVIKHFDNEDSLSSGNDEYFQKRLNYTKYSIDN